MDSVTIITIVRERPEAVCGDLLPVLRRAHVRIVNCECALTSTSAAVWKSGAVQSEVE